MELDGYLSFWGWAYLVVTFGLAVMKREDRDRNGDGIGEVYRSMWGILKLKNIQSFIIIHLIAKIGFQANDAVTSLKLLDKGLKQEQLSRHRSKQTKKLERKKLPEKRRFATASPSQRLPPVPQCR